MGFKPTHHLLIRDWKQDVVNLVQFPRTHTIVSPSPFALKLETWLRMNQINYHNLSNDFAKGSSKGQVPFIELNGRQFSDSNFIIDHLTQAFNLSMDRNLTTRERAEARALTVLIEESLFRCLAYDRSQNFSWVATEKGFLPYFSGFKKFIAQKLMVKQIESNIKKNLIAQGYGRHTPAEIEEIAKKDISAISAFLGNKRYLFGDKPSTVDATLFGHLVQFLDTPLNSDKIRPYVEQNAPNLVEFCKRIKSEYWPDWNPIIQDLLLNKEEGKSETTEATTAK